MPKQKTSRGAGKRFKINGAGKIVRRRANKSHILTKKHPKRKRRLRKSTVMAPADQRRLKPLLQF